MIFNEAEWDVLETRIILSRRVNVTYRLGYEPLISPAPIPRLR